MAKYGKMPSGLLAFSVLITFGSMQNGMNSVWYVASPHPPYFGGYAGNLQHFRERTTSAV